jgi:hypothetical protein
MKNFYNAYETYPRKGITERAAPRGDPGETRTWGGEEAQNRTQNGRVEGRVRQDHIVASYRTRLATDQKKTDVVLSCFTG